MKKYNCPLKLTEQGEGGVKSPRPPPAMPLCIWDLTHFCCLRVINVQNFLILVFSFDNKSCQNNSLFFSCNKSWHANSTSLVQFFYGCLPSTDEFVYMKLSCLILHENSALFEDKGYSLIWQKSVKDFLFPIWGKTNVNP